MGPYYSEYSPSYAECMLAIPGRQGSVALTDMAGPPTDDGPVLVQTQANGVCGHRQPGDIKTVLGVPGA